MSYGALLTIAVLCLTGQLAIADSNIKNGIIADNIKGANTHTGIIKDANTHSGIIATKHISDANIKSGVIIEGTDTQNGITGKFIEDTNTNTGEDEWVGSVEELQESEEIVTSNANRRSSEVERYLCNVSTPPLQMVAQMSGDAIPIEIAWDIKELDIESGEYETKWSINKKFGNEREIYQINAASISPKDDKVPVHRGGRACL